MPDRTAGRATPAGESRWQSGREPPAALLLGAGDRGRVYTNWILRHPGRMRVTAVAEPDAARRDHIRTRHRLPAELCFTDWRDALSAGLPVEAVIIATQDRMHTEPAIRSLQLGYHVLLEKPMAPTREEMLAIAEAERMAAASTQGPANANATPAAREAGAGDTTAAAGGPTLTVCHVLRYSSFFRAVRRVLDAGEIGEIQSIFLAENVAYYHFAHSYVRGNWSNSATSSPLILAKSCHDLDILCWLAGALPERVFSTAGLDYFTSTNAPEAAPGRCHEGCPVAATCLYEAERTYLRGVPIKTALAAAKGRLAWAACVSLRAPGVAALMPLLRRYSVWKEWPTTAVTTDLTAPGIRSALRSGPYGRCVFRCDNDQPDHQDTVITFANGVTATFRLHGRSHAEGRTFRLDGSLGTLRGRLGSDTVLELSRHGAAKPIRIPVKADLLGHSEADSALMDAWTAGVAGNVGPGRRTGAGQGQAPQTNASASVASHLLAFAAHESVLTGESQSVAVL